MSTLEQLRDREEELEAMLTNVRESIKRIEGPNLGKLPNRRAGFHHIHSDSYECGIAYRQYGWDDADKWRWAKCSKLVNHEGGCGYEDNTAY